MSKEDPSGKGQNPVNCVIIGDIKKSRKLDHWKEIFTAFQDILGELNRIYSGVITVSFQPTVGDEFQGAIRTPGKAIEIYYLMKTRIAVEMYFGVGIGRVEKPIDEELGMRGDAFYRARDALQMCKKRNRDIIVKAAPDHTPLERVVNTVLHFVEVMERSWTNRQREIVEYYRLHPGHTYEKIGEHFGCTKQAVSDVLLSAHYKVVAEGIDLVRDSLQGGFSPGEWSS